MGAINLKHTSGNGTILNSPAANPSSDITLKLPSTTGSAGQVLSVASANHSSTNAELEFAAGGKILQVVSTNVSATSSSVLSNYPTLVESPATITFNSVGLNSHFVISGQIGGEANTSDHVIGFVLQRIVGGVTTNINVGTADGNRAAITAIQNQGYGGVNNASTPSSTSFGLFRDSPNQAAGTSIKYVFSVCKIAQSGTITYYFGRSVSDTDTGDYERLPCNITVMEEAA